MTETTGTPPTGRWRADVIREYHCVAKEKRMPWGEKVTEFWNIPVTDVVITKPGYEAVRFRVNRREDRRLSFSDPRERLTGTAGTGGYWNTRQKQRPGRRRLLTPTAWKVEVSRLIGEQRAEEIIRQLRGE